MTTLQSTAWRLSPSLKRAQLQQIAAEIGAPLTGTKPQLLSSIHDTIAQTQKLLDIQHGQTSVKRCSRKLRVLSIDMGIRNLAYAVFEHELGIPHPDKEENVKPCLIKWQRINFGGSNMMSTTPSSEATLKEHLVKDELAVSDVSRESFEPVNLAVHAYHFGRFCTDLQPTHILIERQRFRSGGHAAVQEWSLRVGMLEAMLYAVFQTLISEKLVDAFLEPVLPARVNKYWFDSQQKRREGSLSEQDLTAPTGKQAKLAKIALVTAMVTAKSALRSSFTLHPDLSSLAGMFSPAKTLRKSAKTQPPAFPHSSKLDDLSDSLLQGLAWLHWQENRLKITTER